MVCSYHAKPSPGGANGVICQIPSEEDAMTLIAEKDGEEVARIHGPYQGQYVLEFRNPGGTWVRRVSRSNVQVLRILAELVYPDLVWNGVSQQLDAVGVCSAEAFPRLA